MSEYNEKLTLAEEYQNLLYGLFQEHIFRMDGIEMNNPKTGLEEQYIAKSEFVDQAIVVLNELGKMLNTDKRLTKKENEDEIDSSENCTVS